MSLIRKTPAVVIAAALLLFAGTAQSATTTTDVHYDSGVTIEAENFNVAQNLMRLGGVGSAAAVAASFSLEADANVDVMTFLGGCYSTLDEVDQHPMIEILFHQDDGAGRPGDAIDSAVVVDFAYDDPARVDTEVRLGIVQQPLYRYTVNLTEQLGHALAFEAGTTYWVSMSILNDDPWGWANALPGQGLPTIGAIGVDGTAGRTWILSSGLDFAFTLESGAAAAALLTPSEMIVALIEKVDALDLGKRRTRSLVKKLEGALAVLEDEKDRNDISALWRLRAFVRHVEALSGKKIDAKEADELVADAETVLGLLEDAWRERFLAWKEKVKKYAHKYAHKYAKSKGKCR